MAIYYNVKNKAFYDSDTGIPVPEGSIEITKKQHETFLAGMNNRNMNVVLEKNKLVLKSKRRIVSWNQIRSIRDRLLKECDYTQMPDWPGDKAAWANYRQQLRELPENFKEPESVIWPKRPR